MSEDITARLRDAAEWAIAENDHFNPELGVEAAYTIEALRKELNECKAELDKARDIAFKLSDNVVALNEKWDKAEAQLTTIRNETIDECAKIALDEDGEFTDWGEDRNRTISIQTAQCASVAIRKLKETT